MADDKHEKARDIAEEALGAFSEGDEKRGSELTQKAAKIDRSAVEELVQELDEDAGSNHEVPKENR